MRWKWKWCDETSGNLLKRKRLTLLFLSRCCLFICFTSCLQCFPDSLSYISYFELCLFLKMASMNHMVEQNNRVNWDPVELGSGIEPRTSDFLYFLKKKPDILLFSITWYNGFSSLLYVTETNITNRFVLRWQE